MKKIKFILFTLGMAASALAGEPIWLTNLPEAADRAVAEKKLLLLDFTGSDWCGWCMKLDAEAFSTPPFLDFASRNLVLVQLDFPMHKSQSDVLKKANRALKKKYAVSGFPTVLIIKPDGTVLWEQEGYAPGGPKPIMDAANQCRKAAGLAAPAQPTKIAAVPPAQPAPPPASAPTQTPSPPPQKASQEPKLQGILYSPGHSSVVLDGKTCQEGDTVHDLRVLKIARDKVTVEYQGQTKVLRMMEDEGQITVSKKN